MQLNTTQTITRQKLHLNMALDPPAFSASRAHAIGH
jgi:hypothetical protein